MKINELVKNKKVLFVTTKNIDYIRNVQEINILKDNAEEYELIFSNKKSYLFRIIEIWIKLFFKDIKKYDVIFLGFAPQLVLPFFFHKFSGKIIAIDFFISVYETLVCDRKKINSDSIVAKLLHKLDEKTLFKAKHIICDTNEDLHYFKTEFLFQNDRYVEKNDNEHIGKSFEVLYLEADKKIYYPREQCREDELKGKYVVLYFGSILPLQGIDVILDAINEIKDDSIFFEIIGPISSEIKKPNKKNVRYTNWLEQEELAKRVANADLCLAGHFNSKIEKATRTIPGKAFIYEAMNKKMILGDNKANREVFKEDRDHLFCKMSSSHALQNIICMKP